MHKLMLTTKRILSESWAGLALEICPHAAAASPRSVHQHHTPHCSPPPPHTTHLPSKPLPKSAPETGHSSPCTLQPPPASSRTLKCSTRSLSCMCTAVAHSSTPVQARHCTLHSQMQAQAVPAHPIDQCAAPKPVWPSCFRDCAPSPPPRPAAQSPQTFHSTQATVRRAECSKGVQLCSER